ncbi:amidohydrolase [Sphingomonas mucosissima]|uniref:p-aminobenzoyl-glutamate hydrolase subunit B n=1 Tax=Sphingomonas mucosissima TaxID=370959 RepID=A0A245ZRY5_9SPHN|nr:amidohydrolase [Sphingomonas mucosissima]OWK32490.1 p-aminobenzoyl-glutamate hydrolase subunit B [Sphingomonas mucosissima]
MIDRAFFAGFAGAALLVAGEAQAGPLAADAREQVLAGVDAKKVETVGKAIWSFAETGYQEQKSAALLAKELKDAGFQVTMGVVGEPTAFLASYRNGAGPVIGITAEYDALPGLAQQTVPTKTPIAGQAHGHGCGHNLLGAASVAAAIAVKKWMIASKTPGELRVYGTPAEEGGSGKVYMVRDGLFKDVDAAVHWHPAGANSAAQSISMANTNGKFRFYGRSSHASGNPEAGRSALDAVEIMNVATNYLREHVPDRTRIHYVITSGGGAPNVVPDYAEVYYYVRSPDPQVVRSVMARVTKAGEGAAIATETRMEFEQIGGVYSMLPNDTLGQVMDKNLRSLGGIAWTAEEKAFAAKMRESVPDARGTIESVAQVQPYAVRTDPDAAGGSTDMSDISWVVPTVGLGTATFVPGMPGHSWQNTAAAGMSIGTKGAVLASRTLALTLAEMIASPDVIATAKAEMEKRRGPDFRYVALIGNRAPALDYRNNSRVE